MWSLVCSVVCVKEQCVTVMMPGSRMKMLTYGHVSTIFCFSKSAKGRRCVAEGRHMAPASCGEMQGLVGVCLCVICWWSNIFFSQYLSICFQFPALCASNARLCVFESTPVHAPNDRAEQKKVNRHMSEKNKTITEAWIQLDKSRLAMKVDVAQQHLLTDIGVQPPVPLSLILLCRTSW